MKGVYQHYKNKPYLVLCESTHSESMETMVVYQALYGEYGIWVRPKTMFEELLENGTSRFAFVSDTLNSDFIDKYQIDVTKVKNID